MSIQGFSHDSCQDLWIADGFVDLDWSDGSEAYLLKVFEEAGAVGDYPVELAGFIRDWPSRYHLSHLRVNLLEAIRELLDPSWVALEIGGGAGALTKWLARVLARVDVIEGSIQRARVNRVRTQDEQNVRVLVGDMVASPFPDTYDLATLVGVLEYMSAGPDMTRRQACLQLLRKIRHSLREEGMLILAMENRLGAKYWAGCGEDHTTRLFDGLLGYPDDTPVTFSRNELETLLREAGFEYQQFYHLHPDYKLPATVIREVPDLGRVSAHQWTQQFAQDYINPREYFVPDPLLMKSLEDAGLTWQFSNSFLVLCSQSDEVALAENWLVKKFSNSSRPELHHTVTLAERDGKLRVERTPIRGGKSLNMLGDYEYSLSDGDYLPGSLLMVEAYEALMSQQWFERLTTLCDQLLAAARSEFGADTALGHEDYDSLDGRALDFTFWNVIRREDGPLTSIDSKWKHKGPLAADYVLFRSLFFLLSAGSPFVQADLRETITGLLRQFFPQFDDARLDDHLRAEKKLQELVHSGDSSRVHADDQGRLMLPVAGGSIVSKLQRLASAETRATQAAIVESQLEQARAESTELRAGLEEAHAEIGRLSVGLDDARAQGDRLEHELVDTRAQSTELTAQLHAARTESAQLTAQVHAARTESLQLRTESDERAVQLAAVYASTSWRMSAPVRLVGRQMVRLHRYGPVRRVRRRLGKVARHMAPRMMERRARRRAGPAQMPMPVRPERPRDPLLMAAEARSLEYRPLISVLVPVYETDPRYLRPAVDSVLAQAYPEWELILCDDGSTRLDTKAALAEIALLDSRIQVHYLPSNRGIATATNTALAKARGDFVALLDHDDELLPAALMEVAKALNSDRELDVIYTDQDYVEADGSLAQAFYKPDWSLEMFRGVMYVGHLLVVRRSLADAIGGFDPAFDKVQDFEFMLRLAESTTRIAHIPEILYHWRKIPGSVAFGGNEKSDIEPLQAKAVNAHLERCGVNAVARSNPAHAHRLVITPKPRTRYPLISVLVRASGFEAHVETCCRQILTMGSWPNKEIVVTGASIPDQLRGHLEEMGVTVMGTAASAGTATSQATASSPAPASSPATPASPPTARAAAPGEDDGTATLAGLKLARGDIVVFMDGDLEMKSPDWLEHLSFECELPGVACVTPLILNPDGLVSDAGLILEAGGVAGPAMKGWRPESDGYAGSLSCVREVSAVSGDCYAISRSVLDELGGLCPYVTGSRHQALDLSLRSVSAGLRNLCTPRVAVRHRTPARSAGQFDALDELLLMDAWELLFKEGDPFHNRNFQQIAPGYQA